MTDDDLTGGQVDRRIGQIRAYIDSVKADTTTLRLLVECVGWLLRWQAKVTDAIRAHRDARGDDRCWRDDDDLYSILPEGYTPPTRDTAVELERCKRFIELRQHPGTEYVSPQREIERLENVLAQIARMARGGYGPTTHKARLETIARMAESKGLFE